MPAGAWHSLDLERNRVNAGTRIVRFQDPEIDLASAPNTPLTGRYTQEGSAALLSDAFDKGAIFKNMPALRIARSTDKSMCC